MFSTDASRTAAPTQNCTSAAYDASELKIMQFNVGHEADSSTAVYTHVSSDFMNTALHKALAPAFGSGHGGGQGTGRGQEEH